MKWRTYDGNIVVKKVGTKVAQFMGYNNLKPEQNKCNKRNTFKAKHFRDSTNWIWQVPFDKVFSIFHLLEGFVHIPTQYTD